MDSGRKVIEEAKRGELLRYASEYHKPVLWDTVVQMLVTDRSGVYVDGTLGGGGHAEAVLDALDVDGEVIGIDQDSDALAEAGRRLEEHVGSGRLRLVQSNFGKLVRVLAEAGVTQVDGLLLDLGVSSHQLDASSRGFSFSGEGELDMRMDARSGLSAHEVINEWPEHELRKALFAYGEEPRSSRIARAIAASRPVRTTTEVAAIIRTCAPGPDVNKTLARVFQAIRIVVNRELEMLESALVAAVDVIRPGGRFVVISYHSLEDRLVKHYLRYGNREGKPVRDLYGNLLAPWRELTRKPVGPSDEEVIANPRARSARLRVAERLPDVERLER